MLSMLAISEADRLLDLGTGTGAVLRELGTHADQPARAVGIDSSVAMLARAERALAPTIELVHADATALPFADSEFDAATCAYLLHLLDPPARADVLREVVRVLSPGGRLGVVTVAPAVGRLARALSWPVLAGARRSNDALGGLRPLDPRNELRAAGFRIGAARRMAFGYPSLCVLATSARG